MQTGKRLFTHVLHFFSFLWEKMSIWEDHGETVIKKNSCGGHKYMYL